MSEQLKYNYTDAQIEQVVHNVAGFDATNISFERWNKFFARKTEKKKI